MPQKTPPLQPPPPGKGQAPSPVRKQRPEEEGALGRKGSPSCTPASSAPSGAGPSSTTACPLHKERGRGGEPAAAGLLLVLGQGWPSLPASLSFSAWPIRSHLQFTPAHITPTSLWGGVTGLRLRGADHHHPIFPLAVCSCGCAGLSLCHLRRSGSSDDDDASMRKKRQGAPRKASAGSEAGGPEGTRRPFLRYSDSTSLSNEDPEQPTYKNAAGKGGGGKRLLTAEQVCPANRSSCQV